MAQADGAAMFNTTPSQVRPDGSFVINGLTPGNYTLQLMLQNGPGGNFGTSEAEYASAEVTIVACDVDRGPAGADQALDHRRAHHHRFGGCERAASLDTAHRSDSRAVVGTVLGPNAPPVAVNDDWTFEAKGRAGLLRMNLTGLQPPWNVKSVRQRGSM